MNEGKWMVNVFGGPNECPFEISVIRKDYRLGLVSYGWFNDDKLLISHSGGPCKWPVPNRIWNKLLAVAHETAQELNSTEAQ
jgi:hypothetical protein